MGVRVLQVGLAVTLLAPWGCAKERTDLPATRPSPVAPEVRESPVEPQSDPQELAHARGELQSRVLQEQSRIAELSADLNSAQSDLAARRGIVESQMQKEAAMRQEQMREIATSIRTNDEILQSRERELRSVLGPTGTSYEGDENLNSLRREVEALQSRGLELRSAYTSLADENRNAIAESTAVQEQLLAEGKRRQTALAASLADAKAGEQSLRGELAKLADGR